MTPGAYQVQLNFCETFSKLNTLLNSANILETFLKNVLLCDLMDCLCKVFKILAEFNKVFNFEKFLIYVQPKFN